MLCGGSSISLGDVLVLILIVAIIILLFRKL